MNEEASRIKGPDEIYCPECGKLVKKSAVVCISCGIQIKELTVSQPEQPTLQTQSSTQQQPVQASQPSQQHQTAQQFQTSQPAQQFQQAQATQPVQPSQPSQPFQQSPAGPPLVKDPLQEGRFQLSGVRGFYGFFIAIYTIAYVAGTLSILFIDFAGLAGYYKFILLICMAAAYVVMLTLYIIPFAGIIKRKPFSVPFTRVMLIISMFIFPVGTIIGGVLWKRMSNPAAKKYLNHSG